MSTSFYDSILPDVGFRVLAVFKSGLENPPTHIFYDSNEDLISAAETYSGLGKNVYHGCAVYGTSENRKGHNVVAVKCLWADFDVGPKKPYKTKQEAFAAAEKFFNEVGLPKSHVVDSGNGLHYYFAFNKPISGENWDRIAALFAACMRHAGLEPDTTRTQDKASILRVPGTGNFKQAPQKPVVLKRMGVEVPAREIYDKLKAYATANGVSLLPDPKLGKSSATNELVGTKDYPPSEGPRVAQFCPVLQDVAASGGDVDYHVWWCSMGVAKHTTDPQAVAAHWTRNRAATGHGKHDWQKAIAEWPAGPTTCSKFAEDPNAAAKCSGCKFAGKITSPIQLGVPELPVNAPVTPPEAKAPASAMATKLPGPWDFGAQWITDKIAAACKVGFANGKTTMSVQQEDGTYKHVPFCDRYWQVMARIRSQEGIWQLEIAYEDQPGQPPSKFMLDSADVMSADGLRKAFSARELHIYGGNRAMMKTQEIIRLEQAMLHSYDEETAVFPSMGWVTEANLPSGHLTGEFIIGEMILRPKSAPEPVLLHPDVPEDLRKGYRVKGTAADWVSFVDTVYNRPGAEAYQFAIAAAFAAPLVRLMSGAGEWHGIPLIMGGESGAAKTTTAKVAVSIYGPPDAVRFASGPQGDTVNALAAKMGAIRSLPFIVDEMTQEMPEKVSDVLFMTANGRPKDRCAPDGKIIPNKHRWDTLSYITSNESLHDVLRGVRSSESAKAAQLRSFEIEYTVAELGAVFHDVNRSDVDQFIGSNYGAVGREWLQFIVNNRLKISEALVKVQSQYTVENDSSALRKYKDLIVTIQVAATLAKSKGFISWDVQAMIKWAEKKLEMMSVKVADTDWASIASDFVASLQGRTIVTKHMQLGRGRRHATEIPLEPLSSSNPPAARKAIDDSLFYFTSSAMRHWCTTNHVNPQSLAREMCRMGALKAKADNPLQAATVSISIGGGTTVSRPNATCYQLDYDWLEGLSGAGAPDMTNVVAMPAPGDASAASQVPAAGQATP